MVWLAIVDVILGRTIAIVSAGLMIAGAVRFSRGA